jgi:hypothetical protein
MLRNQRVPTAGEVPASMPASPLDNPRAIACQNHVTDIRQRGWPARALAIVAAKAPSLYLAFRASTG